MGRYTTEKGERFMPWGIRFKYKNDIVAASIEGDEATVYWGRAAPRKKKLNYSYTYEWAKGLHPMEIMMGVTQVAGMESQYIQGLRLIEVFTEEDLK